MSENQKNSLKLAAALVIAAAFILWPLFMATHPQHSQHPGKYAESSQGIFGGTAPITGNFRGLKRISEHDCYSGESVGECAARIVQEQVARFYIWLIVLGVAQSGVAFLTLHLLQNQTRNSQVTERAYLRVRIVENGVTVGPISRDYRAAVEIGTIRLSVENTGKTPAIITRISWRTEFVKRNEDGGGIIDPIDPGIVGGREIPPGIESAPGDPYLGESENLRAFPFFHAEEQIASDAATFWVCGFVRYRDVFDQNHIVGFAYVLDTNFNVFVSRGDVRYNYKRSERGRDIPPPS